MIQLITGLLVLSASLFGALGCIYFLGWLERRIFTYPVTHDDPMSRGLILVLLLLILFCIGCLAYFVGSLVIG